MLAVKSWRIYYADGSTFSSVEGTWADAPAFGVACVVYYHVDGKTIHTEANDDSRYHYLGEGDLEGVKLGLWFDSDGYYRVLDRAGRSEP